MVFGKFMGTELYDQILEKQRYQCAICTTHWLSIGELVIDKDIYGRVRGAVCGPCSMALTLFGRSPLRFEMAADYLRRYEKKLEEEQEREK